jgi:hypothetical protein
MSPELVSGDPARVAAAVAALSIHDAAEAARQLDAARAALRGWE